MKPTIIINTVRNGAEEELTMGTYNVFFIVDC